MPPRRRKILKVLVVTSSVLAAVYVGYGIRVLGETDNRGDGHMVLGTATSVTIASRVVCIGDAQRATCGPVVRGDLPIVGSHVEGWLVQTPETDTDYPPLVTRWEWVTTFASR